MLWRGITQGHPFGDGNKGAGFALASYYLSLVGFDPPTDAWDEEELYLINMQLSAGQITEVGELVEVLWEWWGVVETGSEPSGSLPS
jgi:prophage maintenance system killer protein